MHVLGIESTCDETAASIIVDGRTILSNVVATQIDLHNHFGGVFPELASRRHVEAVLPVVKDSLETANLTPEGVDLIAVAQGPGLIGSLIVGLQTAKALALGWNVPIVGVNHVEAHLYAAMMEQEELLFPGLGVVLSGGHTFLVLMTGINDYQLIGTTVDDAIGEAFDKVASMLELPYPGGPAIEALALSGDPLRYPFKRGIVKGRPWDFSFSGLKTNVLYTLKGPNTNRYSPLILSENEKAHVAASFQQTVFSDVVEKAYLAAEKYACKAIYLGGGVSNNRHLRTLFKEQNKSQLPIFWPPFGLSLDNAAMIAGLGYHVYNAHGPSSFDDLQPKPRIPLPTSVVSRI